MATFTAETKSITAESKLLKEDSFYLLLESGYKIVLARGWGSEVKHATTFTSETKN